MGAGYQARQYQSELTMTTSSKRKSIHIPGFVHKNPIPNASLVGNLLMSGSIIGNDPVTGKIAPTLEEQCALVFRYMREIVAAAGGTTDDIIKIHVWLNDLGNRAPLNAEWIKMFPDEHSRPARHAIQSHFEGGKLLECDVIAVIGARG